VESIKEDVRWLWFDWEDREFYASDYFGKLYEYAVELVKRGKAYVCDLSTDQIREYRGTLTKPGVESPYSNRSVEENLDQLEVHHSQQIEFARLNLSHTIMSKRKLLELVEEGVVSG